ncbi:hypothetical protein ACWEFL_07330 [Streptomyces sp. NPDC004838]
MLGRPRLRIRLAVALAATALAVGVAQAPASAGETGALAYRSGISYSSCYLGEAIFSTTPDGTHGGHPNSDASGSGRESAWASCSWIDSGVLQWSGYRWRSGAWHHFGWLRPPALIGPGNYEYDLTINDVRDVHFRVCNIQNGVVGGCAPVT